MASQGKEPQWAKIGLNDHIIEGDEFQLFRIFSVNRNKYIYNKLGHFNIYGHHKKDIVRKMRKETILKF